jgi:hypothetical protein
MWQINSLRKQLVGKYLCVHRGSYMFTSMLFIQKIFSQLKLIMFIYSYVLLITNQTILQNKIYFEIIHSYGWPISEKKNALLTLAMFRLQRVICRHLNFCFCYSASENSDCLQLHHDGKQITHTGNFLMAHFLGQVKTPRWHLKCQLLTVEFSSNIYHIIFQIRCGSNTWNCI